MTIGKLERVPLRDVWDDEALNFTPWLKAHIDVLNEVLEHEEIDIYLTEVNIEQEAGDFSVDMVAKTDSGDIVIIENQLEQSDHDHLGKIITYLTSFGAKNAIWINSYPRSEHIKAINWLNESTNAYFYLFKLEAIKIDESNHAPLLTLIVGKNKEMPTREIDERHRIRYEFWDSLLKFASTKTPLHSRISPSYGSFISVTADAPKAGLYLNYDILMHSAKVELYIDAGHKTKNKNIYDKLEKNRIQIETDFGDQLEWNRLEDKKACRIMKTLEIGGYRDEKDKWPEIQNAMVEAMIRLETALRPHIESI
jgi:hypothetical protein